MFLERTSHSSFCAKVKFIFRSPNKDLSEVPMDMFAGHYNLITNVILEYNSIQKLPDDLFTVLKNLMNLNLKGNQITELPTGK